MVDSSASAGCRGEAGFTLQVERCRLRGLGGVLFWRGLWALLFRNRKRAGFSLQVIGLHKDEVLGKDVKGCVLLRGREVGGFFGNGALAGWVLLHQLGGGVRLVFAAREWRYGYALENGALAIFLGGGVFFHGNGGAAARLGDVPLAVVGQKWEKRLLSATFSPIFWLPLRCTCVADWPCG